MQFFVLPAFQLEHLAAVIIILFVISIVSFFKKSLSNSGILVGNSVGIVVFLLAGLSAFLAIAAFFVIAEFSTRYARKKLKKDHEQRTISNILANCLAAIIALAFGSMTGFFAAVAAALGDTVSGEIGMLSRKKPKLITSFEEVDVGTDGAITPEGLVAGIIGAAIIGLIYFFVTKSSFLFMVIVVSGFAGCLVDSVLGALFERKGKLNNEQVNFIASLFGAVFAVTLVFMF